MKQITFESIQAFNANQNFKRSNMQVICNEDKTTLFLHGNPIAQRNKDGFFIQNCGWFSNTTKERLNGFDGVHIQQRNFEWFLNGQKWDGQPTKINF